MDLLILKQFFCRHNWKSVDKFTQKKFNKYKNTAKVHAYCLKCKKKNYNLSLCKLKNLNFLNKDDE
jgi:hypothetical protein